MGKKSILASGIFLTLLFFNVFLFKLSFTNFLLLAVWYVFIWLLGLMAFPLVSLALPLAPDRGWGVSKVVGLLIFGYINWIIPGLFGFPYNSFLALMSFFAMIALAIRLVLKNHKYRNFRRIIVANIKNIATVEIIFASGFFLCLVLNSFHPEIYWGEKPMDFALLNFMVRNTELPITDPWAAGHIMKYYYLGYYIFGGLLKLIPLPTQIGYHICLATISGLMISTLFSLFYLIGRRRILSAVSAFLLVWLSNWQSFAQILFEGQLIGFRTLWHATRVFENEYFAEFPSWSLLFADLHPHVMAYPFTMAFITFAYYFVIKILNQVVPFNFAYMGLLALLWGGLLGINTWDFIIYTIIFALLILFNLDLKQTFRKTAKAILIPIASALGSGLLFFPLFEVLSQGKPIRAGFVLKNRDTFINYFRHDGHWWLLILALAVPLLKHIINTRPRSLAKFEYRDIFVVLPAAIIIFLKLLGWGGLDYLTLSLLTFVSLLIHLISRLGVDTPSKKASFDFFICATVLMYLCQSTFFMDKINTIFKGFNNVWILFGISFFSLFNYFPLLFRQGLRTKSTYKKILRLTPPGLVGILIFLLLLGTCYNTIGVSHIRAQLGTRPSLDGSQYLKFNNRGDYEIVRWIQEYVTGTPPIVESYGQSFDHRTARISMHTGLPSYLGWIGHVIIRGYSKRDTIDRRREISFIYSSPDALKVYELLRRRGIEYVVLGNIEREKYQGDGLLKFNQFSDLFQPVVKYGSTVLYKVKQN